jgi:hypothetical protein
MLSIQFIERENFEVQILTFVEHIVVVVVVVVKWVPSAVVKWVPSPHLLHDISGAYAPPILVVVVVVVKWSHGVGTPSLHVRFIWPLESPKFLKTSYDQCNWPVNEFF